MKPQFVFQQRTPNSSRRLQSQAIRCLVVSERRGRSPNIYKNFEKGCAKVVIDGSVKGLDGILLPAFESKVLMPLSSAELGLPKYDQFPESPAKDYLAMPTSEWSGFIRRCLKHQGVQQKGEAPIFRVGNASLSQPNKLIPTEVFQTLERI